MDDLLGALASYSDTDLWEVVYHRLSDAQSRRLRELSAKNKRAALEEIEQTELDELLNLVDEQMLLRSEALLLLKQRGQDIDRYLSGSHSPIARG